MHSRLLFIRPSQYEERYFEQLEALDLVNCIIAPMFFANSLALWTRGLLAATYCAVLLIKGYQLGLLLLPGARRAKAYRKARYWLILGERVLRQFVATPALGRGPRFLQWLQHMAASTASPTLLVLKVLILISGATISFWNAFCLPLDFISQACVNAIFFCIHFPPIVSQVAYAVAMMVRGAPRVVWLQWWVERAAARATRLLRPLLRQAGPAAGLLAALPAGAQRAAAAACGGGDDAACQAGAAAWLSPPEAVAAPPRAAPDLDTVAGRLVLALSTAWMLFGVLLVPLYLSWRLERHLKSKYMATLVPACQRGSFEQQQEQDGAQGRQQRPWWRRRRRWGQGDFVRAPVVFPLMPDTPALLAHLGRAAAASLVAAEGFVWLCSVSPAVRGMLWRQLME